ncbi:MAG: transposase, partial [Chitinispirillaceae bacterium]|nr:transposase [Chitinispirillaceae bacterium]
MDHARRGFEKSLTNDKQRASHALDLIRQLYEVEKTAREQNLTPADRLALRREKSAPVYHALIAWCTEQLGDLRPKPPIGKAILYVLER